MMDPEEFQEMASGIGRWIANHTITGTSSRALACCALVQSQDFGPSGGFPDHPHDAPDLKRCVDLIEQVPGVALALPIIAKRSDVWAVYVANWPELTMLANMSNCQTTTARMRELRCGI